MTTVQSAERGLRPLVTVDSDAAVPLIVACLARVGDPALSDLYVLRERDLQEPWPQPAGGYAGLAEVARVLVANGWRNCRIRPLPVADAVAMAARGAVARTLHSRVIAAAIAHERAGLGG